MERDFIGKGLAPNMADDRGSFVSMSRGPTPPTKSKAVQRLIELAENMKASAYALERSEEIIRTFLIGIAAIRADALHEEEQQK